MLDEDDDTALDAAWDAEANRPKTTQERVDSLIKRLK